MSFKNNKANGQAIQIAPSYKDSVNANMQDLSNSGVPDIYENNLPPGWEAKWDHTSQKPYWVDHTHKMSTWVDPRNTYTAPPANAPSYEEATRENFTGTLPPGWREARTPEGQVYYINDALRRTQWERPT